MVKELISNIAKEVQYKLDDMYNWRKHGEDLVSVHNCLINSLKNKVNEWVQEEINKNKWRKNEVE